MDEMKKYRSPKAKPGELKAQWGKLPGDNPAICYAWGDGVGKCDAHLLHNAFSCKTHNPINDTWDISFFEELEKRGYDMTTLKFSIQKKVGG